MKLKEESIEEAIKRLREVVAYYDKLYYRDAAPEILDYDYDRLKNELEQLEQQHPELKLEDSPTNRVGDDRIEAFKSYPHKKPMLSIDNSYNKEEIFEFDKRIQRLLGEQVFEYVIEPKIDGVGVSLTYEKGKFVRALTRGNGVSGDDITHNVLTIKGVPKELVGGSVPEYIEIRGEIFITQSEFERINAERLQRELPLYANPRNLAAGTVKLLDAKEAAERKLNVVVYGIGFIDPDIFEDQGGFHEQLKAWGFCTHEKYWLAHGIEEAWGCIKELDEICNNLSYGTDGAVVKLNKRSLYEEAGYTAKAPRWVISYKFAPEEAETLLKSITVQVGRTGVLTPVAELEPVELAGTTVSRATLHNQDEITRKDIRIGDSVVVVKAGEIIPAVVRVIKDKRQDCSEPYHMPDVCPACGSKVVQLLGEAASRCPDLSCPPQVKRRILHFGSRQAMDIENLGKSVVDALVEHELCKNIADLYSLTVNDLLQLDNFAEKSAENLIQAIEQSKEQDFWRLLHGIGIPQVGAQSSKDLAQKMGSLEALMNADEVTLQEIDGVGKVVAESIVQFFRDPDNRAIMNRLESYGLKTKEDVSLEKTGHELIFSNRTFVLTGTLPTWTRDQAKELIENAGGRVSSSVSKKTSYVLAGESAGSKLFKAESLEVSILDEATFNKMLSDANIDL